MRWEPEQESCSPGWACHRVNPSRLGTSVMDRHHGGTVGKVMDTRHSLKAELVGVETERGRGRARVGVVEEREQQLPETRGRLGCFPPSPLTTDVLSRAPKVCRIFQLFTVQ